MLSGWGNESQNHRMPPLLGEEFLILQTRVISVLWWEKQRENILKQNGRTGWKDDRPCAARIGWQFLNSAGLPGLARCYLIFLFTEGKGNTSHTVFLISASSALSCHAAGTMIPEESFCPFSLSSSFLWLGSRSSWAVKVFWGAYLEPLHWIPYGLKHAWIVWFDLHGPRNWDTGTFAQGVFLAGD